MADNKNKTGLIIGAVVIAAIGGGYLLFRSWSKGTSLTPVEAAQIVPEEAVFAGYFATDSETWSKLSQFGTPEFKKLVTKPIKEKIEQASKENSDTEAINYQEDIQPWLGNIMLAWLPSETEEPKILLVAGIKDKVEALKFIDKLKKETEESIQTSEYKGFTIIETKRESEEPFNIAILDDIIVAAPEEKTVKMAIDTYQGSSSFADKNGAKEILTQTSNNKDTLFQFYVPNYTSLLKQSMEASGQDMATFKSIQKQLDYVDSMVISVGIEENRGILMQTMVKLNPSSNIPKYSEISGQVLAQIPGNSLLLISGGGINQTWSWFIEQFGEDPEFKDSLEQARTSLKANADLDLERDIMSWMDGELAISILPSNTPPVPVKGAMVITTSDRSTAENTLEKIEKLARSNGAPINNRNLDGKEITEYKNHPGGQVILAYGWLDDKSLAISLADKADSIFSIQPSESIAQNPDFQESIRNFPQKNFGYFYLNFKEVNSLLDNLANSFGQPIPPESKAVLDSIITIAGVTSMPNSYTAKHEFLFELETSSNNK